MRSLLLSWERALLSLSSMAISKLPCITFSSAPLEFARTLVVRPLSLFRFPFVLPFLFSSSPLLLPLLGTAENISKHPKYAALKSIADLLFSHAKKVDEGKREEKMKEVLKGPSFFHPSLLHFAVGLDSALLTRLAIDLHLLPPPSTSCTSSSSSSSRLVLFPFYFIVLFR